MNVQEIRQLVAQLKAENDPSNNLLIAFYENKIQEVVDAVIGKYRSKVQQLKDLNDPSNNVLIAIYENAIQDAINANTNL